MSDTVLAVVPLLSALCYAGLLTLVRRGAARSSRVVLVYLVLMATWSTCSLIWRLSPAGGVAQAFFLRSLEAFGMVVAPVFLLMLQDLYPSRWSKRAQYAAFVIIAIGSVFTLSGLLDRAVVTPDPSMSALERTAVLAVMTIGCMFVPYALSVGYIIFNYRAQRDPFERNKLKFAAVAVVCIFMGMITNLVGVLRQLPLDHAANFLAAAIMAFSAVRYRMFDIDVLMRRSVVRIVATVPSIVLALTMMAIAFPQMRPLLSTISGATFAFGVMYIVGFSAPFMRAATENAVDRLLIGGHLVGEQAVVALSRHTLEIRDVETIASEVSSLAQRTTESGCVAIMLIEPDGERLRLAAMAGPFQRLRPEWAIRRDNPVLKAIAAGGEALTPRALEELLTQHAFDEADVAEFRPYLDHIVSPIAARGELVGCVLVAPKVYDSAFSIAELDTLTLISAQAGLAIHSALLFEQMRERAQTDFLTGLPNHRHLQEVVPEFVAAAEASNQQVSVAMIDVDNFKMLNDVHGHLLGDEALKKIATALRDSLREEDVVGRYGGDEFLVVMPGLNAESASESMLRATRAVKRLSLVATGPDGAEQRLPTRISWGLATFPDAGHTVRALVSAADSQLLQQRFAMRRTGGVHTDRPTVRELLEQDPEKLRVARALLDIIDAKDPYTSEHSQQIAAFALLVSDELALPDRERYALWLGSLLHDVGKIGTPAWVLRKPGRLTPDEWDLMRAHPILGEQMVRGLLDMQEVIDIVGCHHERYDGGGYPRGLAGHEIPRLARVVSVADSFSAMVHDRPYRKGLSWAEACEELRRVAGTQLDPEMVEAFIRAVGHDQHRPAEAA